MLSAEEKAALRELAKERKAEEEGKNAEAAVLAKIASLPEPDRALAKKVHAIVKASAPALKPKPWYGMPAYADNAGKIVCFFQDAAKFKSKYATLGFDHDNAGKEKWSPRGTSDAASHPCTPMNDRGCGGSARAYP